MDGKFSVHRSPGVFNGVWMDMALEQIFNRDGKTALLSGINQNLTAKEKYKAVPFLTQVSKSITSMSGIDQKISKHHGEGDAQSNRES